jgi:hypothetical protein
LPKIEVKPLEATVKYGEVVALFAVLVVDIAKSGDVWFAVPEIESVAYGELVPMPTLPELEMVK